MGRVVLGLLGLLIAFSGAAWAQCNVPTTGTVVGTFSADGILDAPKMVQMNYFIDFGAGATGTVAATARIAPPAPFFTPATTNFQALLGTAGASCTADCAMKLLADFDTVRFTMTTLAGGTVTVYASGCER